MGRHIDKLDADAAKKIHTLPVLLGERLARAFTVSLIVLQYVLVGYLMIIGFFTPVMLIVLLSLCPSSRRPCPGRHFPVETITQAACRSRFPSRH